MKIYDIITEDQNIEENKGRLAAMALKGLGKLFGGNRAELVKDVSKQLAAKGKWAGPATPAEVTKALKQLGPEATKMAKADPSIVDDIVKNANKVRSPGVLSKAVSGATNAGKVAAQTTSVATNYATNVLKFALPASYYYMFWEPLSMYLDNVAAAETYVNSGGPDSITEKDFEAYRQREMNALIGKWAMLWGTGKLVKMPFGAVTKLFGSLSPKVGGILKAMTPGVQAYFMQWVNKPENSKEIAEFMASPLVQAVGLGALGTNIEDKIRGILPFAKEYEKAQNALEPGAQDSTGQQTQPDTKDAGQGAKPSEPAQKTEPQQDKPTKKDPAEWMYHSPGFVQNKRTGEIDYAN